MEFPEAERIVQEYGKALASTPPGNVARYQSSLPCSKEKIIQAFKIALAAQHYQGLLFGPNNSLMQQADQLIASVAYIDSFVDDETARRINSFQETRDPSVAQNYMNFTANMISTEKIEEMNRFAQELTKLDPHGADYWPRAYKLAGLEYRDDRSFQTEQTEPPHSDLSLEAVKVELVAGMIVVFLILLVFSIVQAFRFRVDSSDYQWIMAGSVVGSLCAVLYYSDIKSTLAGSNKSPLAFIVAPLGLLTWAFLSYLFFYRGLWALTDILEGEFVWPILRALFFGSLSYRAVRKFEKLTGIERTVTKEFRAQSG